MYYSIYAFTHSRIKIIKALKYDNRIKTKL